MDHLWFASSVPVPTFGGGPTKPMETSTRVDLFPLCEADSVGLRGIRFGHLVATPAPTGEMRQSLPRVEPALAGRGDPDHA